MKKTHDYIHHYRSYWSDGGRCRIRIYREEGLASVVVCSQLPDNANLSERAERVEDTLTRTLGKNHCSILAIS